MSLTQLGDLHLLRCSLHTAVITAVTVTAITAIIVIATGVFTAVIAVNIATAVHIIVVEVATIIATEPTDQHSTGIVITTAAIIMELSLSAIIIAIVITEHSFICVILICKCYVLFLLTQQPG